MHFITMTQATMLRIQAEWAVTFTKTEELNGGLVVVITPSGVIAALIHLEQTMERAKAKT